MMVKERGRPPLGHMLLHRSPEDWEGAVGEDEVLDPGPG